MELVDKKKAIKNKKSHWHNKPPFYYIIRKLTKIKPNVEIDMDK